MSRRYRQPFTNLRVHGYYESDRTSEVEVTFPAEGQNRTRVTLMHRYSDRHGAGWQSLRDGLEAENGWPLYLSRYEALTRGGVDAS